MTYLKKTLEYLFVLERGKRAILLFLISVPAGVTLSFVAPTGMLTEWLSHYTVGNTDFWFLWNYGGRGLFFWIWLAVLYFLSVFCISVLSSIVSRSLRVGKFKINSLAEEFNDSFFAGIFTASLYMILFLVGKTLVTLLMVLWQTVRSVLFSAVLSGVTLLAVMFGMCVFGSFTLLLLPLMSFNGLRFRPAVAGSVQKCGRVLWRIVPALAVPLAVLAVSGGLLALIRISLLSKIWDIVAYSMMFPYLVTLTMVSYYDIENIPREDYPREYFFRNRK
jgi:hypothetical protein